MSRRASRAGAADAPAAYEPAAVATDRRVVLEEAAARAIAAGSLSVGSPIPLQAAAVLGEEVCAQLVEAEEARRAADQVAAPAGEGEHNTQEDG